jgi:hypothetical protein
LAVDEPLYRRLPAFLIATVDKFASLPWVGQAGALLGGAERYDSAGFYGGAEPGKGARLTASLPPPDLIIQDELHLISYRLHNGLNRGFQKLSSGTCWLFFARGVIRLRHLIRGTRWSNAAKPRCEG